MSTVRQVQAHQSLMWPHDCLIDLQISWTAAERLHIHTPLFRVQAECFQSALLAEQFHCVNVLVATVVPCSWIALGVLVRHGRSKSIEDGSGGDILGSNKEDRLSLALDLLLLRIASVC